MKLSIIVAMTDERVIGLGNKLPWHLSEDLKRFKQLTMGKPIIMGRKTFESLKSALPGRTNIVVTRNQNYSAKGASVAHSLTESRILCKTLSPIPEEIFVIGGAEIYREALVEADRLYITQIHHPFKGDVVFPEFDLGKFKILEKETHQSSGPEKFSYEFIVAERK